MLFASELFVTDHASFSLAGRLTGRDTVLLALSAWGRNELFLKKVLAPVTAIADLVCVSFPTMWELPVDGRSSVDVLAAGLNEIRHAVGAGKRVVLLGESLGALVAMAASTTVPPHWAILLDPPRQLSKAAWIGEDVGAAILRSSYRDFHRTMVPLMEDLFRGNACRKNEELFAAALVALSHRCVIVGGDPSYQPSDPKLSDGPCCLTEADLRTITERHGQAVPVVQIAGAGHRLLNRHAAPVIQLIAQSFRDDHGASLARAHTATGTQD